MNPYVNREWFSPLCLWVEKRMGDERQRKLAKRYIATLLVAMFLLMAMDTFSLPRHIRTIWSREFPGEILHVSGLRHSRYGHVLAVSLSRDPYTAGTDRILLVSTDGEVVGELCGSIPVPVSDILYLPDINDPDMILAIPHKYYPGDVYVIKPTEEGLAGGVAEPLTTEPCSPGWVDSMAVGGDRWFLVGFSPLGLPYVSTYLYESDRGLETFWVKSFHSDAVYANLMTLGGRDEPVVLVTEEDDLLSTYSMNGSKLVDLNLTEVLLSREACWTHTGIRINIRGDYSLWGRTKSGVFFTAFETKHPERMEGTLPRSFIVLVDAELRVLDLWEGVDLPSNDAWFTSSEAKVISGDVCLNMDGEISWIRRGSWGRTVVNLEDNGEEVVVSTKPSTLGLFKSHTSIRIFDIDGRFVARGLIREGWGHLAMLDLDLNPGERGSKEILYYSDTTLRAFKVSETPYLPRLLTEASLMFAALLFLLVLVRGSWPPERLAGIVGHIKVWGKGKAEQRPIPKSLVTSSARLVSHQEYRTCSCGSINPIANHACSKCGREFRPGRNEPADLSVMGMVSRLGLLLGSAGFLILFTTPLVWSVARSGLLFKVIRSFYSVVSPAVPYGQGIFLFLSLLSFLGISLIYLERAALLGGLACIIVSLFSLYITVSRINLSLFPLILIGICGTLQFVQYVQKTRVGNGAHTIKGSWGHVDLGE